MDSSRMYKKAMSIVEKTKLTEKINQCLEKHAQELREKMQKSGLFNSSEIEEAVEKASLLALENVMASIPKDMVEIYNKKMEQKEHPTEPRKNSSQS